MYVGVCVYVCGGSTLLTHVPGFIDGGQRVSYRNQFSPYAIWILGIEPMLSGLVADAFTYEASLGVCFLKPTSRTFQNILYHNFF